MRPSGTARELEQRRVLAVRLLSQGMSCAEVAYRVNADPRSVRRWRAAARTDNQAGLAAKPIRGRPPRLTCGDLIRLRWMLTADAQAFAVPVREWTCAKVAGLIQQQFGVRYHRAHVNRILRKLGIAPPKH